MTPEGNVEQHNAIDAAQMSNIEQARGSKADGANGADEAYAMCGINYAAEFCMRCILQRIICIFKHFHSALGIIKSDGKRGQRAGWNVLFRFHFFFCWWP